MSILWRRNCATRRFVSFRQELLQCQRAKPDFQKPLSSAIPTGIACCWFRSRGAHAPWRAGDGAFAIVNLVLCFDPLKGISARAPKSTREARVLPRNRAQRDQFTLADFRARDEARAPSRRVR